MNKTLRKSSRIISTKFPLLDQSETEYKINILVIFTETKVIEKMSKNKLIIK